jgi:hypothetical protein
LPSDAPTRKRRVEANVQVNQKVGDICLRARHGNISEGDALERLFEQEDVLKLDDYNYLHLNGVFNGVKRWAKDQMDKLLSVSDEEVEDYMEKGDPVERAIAK